MAPATPPRSIRIPDEIWQAAKARAAREGTTVTAIIMKALRRYGAGHSKEGSTKQ